MKLSNLLFIAMGLSLVPSYMMAEEIIVDSVKYSYTSNTTASVVGYVEGLTHAIILDTVNGHKVTSIERYAFADCSSLASIDIPVDVTSIEYAAFNRCGSLISIVIPTGVTSINEYVLSECSSLSSIVLPDGVTSIGGHAFTNCYSLASINLPDGITSIGEMAFYDCKSLTSIILPNGLKSIGSEAFEYCPFNSIVFPDGLTSIGSNAFSYCGSLTSIVIDGSTSIRNYAFYNCSIEKCTILGNKVVDYDLFRQITQHNCLLFVEDGLYDKYMEDLNWAAYSAYIISADMLKQKTVELTADEGRSSLFTVLGDSSVYTGNLKIKGTINGYDIMTLRNKTFHLLYLDLSEASIVANDGGYEYYTGYSLKADNVLGDYSFADLYLTEVVLPETLKSVGNSTFRGCKYLERVVLQDGLISIGSEAFKECALNDINLPGSLIEIGSSAFCNCSHLGGVLRIPDKISIIKSSSFAGIAIDTLIVGKDVCEIGSSAFQDCSSLKEITFNRKLSKIGGSAFKNCSNLMAANLPYTVEVIEGNVFQNCSALESIKIPSMTKRIGNLAFDGCVNLRNIYTYTVEPTEINQQTFSTYKYATLNVPKTSADIYRYNTQWSQFAFVHEFDEPYDAFYLNGDVELDDETGRMSGEPDAEMYSQSGFIVTGDSVQELSDIEISHDGTNGATIIGASGDISGNQVNLTAKSMKVNISVDGNRWYFFCFPFDVVRDSLECTTDYVFYSYDGSKRANQGSGWTKMDADFGSLQKGLGYIFQASRSGILTVHVGAEYLTFTANNEKDALHAYESNDASNASWNFIGNPYISYYDVQDLAKEYDAPIIVWNGRGYDAYKPGEDDYQLKPFEAFFVQKETGTSYVEFLPVNRMTYNQAAKASSLHAARRAQMGTPMDLDRQLVNISIMSQDSLTDRTRIVYSVNASMDYEIGVDAAKFQADGVPQLYTLNGKTKYAINERPMGTDEIKLGYTAPKAGTYTLSVTRHDAEVEIYDNVTKCKVDFTFGDYSFQSQAGTFNDRFVVYKTGDGATRVEDGFILDGITVRTDHGHIIVDGLNGVEIEVYQSSGVKMETISTDGSYSFPTGVYMIKIGDRSVKTAVM